MTEAFADAGKAPGLKIWRVEQMKPVLHDEVLTSGKLFSGDAYVVLQTVSTSSGLVHSIHFWIGKTCSTDEAGSAAILATDLDRQLGGTPTICRHTQGMETAEFMKLFPNGVLYQEGGVASGLKKADATKASPVLYQLTGDRAGVRIVEVPCATASLNAGDCFVLDTQNDVVLQWVGKDSSSTLKLKALEFASKVRADLHAGAGQLGCVNQGDSSPEAQLFFKTLGAADASSVQIPAAASPSSKPSPPVRMYAVVYSCDDGTGEGWPLKMDSERIKSTYTEARTKQAVKAHRLQEVTETPSAAMLKADTAYMLLAGGSVWVWLGKFVPADLRKIGLSLAEKVIFQNELPSSTPVQVVKQGLESPLFKQYFADWDALQAQALASEKARLAENQEEVKEGSAAVDVAALAAGASVEEPPVDDGTGKKKVWRIEQFELVEVPEAEHGNLYAGDCYVVLYTYGKDDAPQHLLYMWQGRDASPDERGACAMQAVKVDEAECKGSATQVRVTQGKEPKHFVDIWQGGMLVHLGGVASGFRTLAQDDEDEGDTPVRLYHINNRSGSAFAVQVEPVASSLNSGDVFVVITADKAYTWNGKLSTADEQAAAAAVVKRLLAGAKERESVTVAEEAEDDAFWGALGGKGEYSKEPSVSAQNPPRLFQVNDAKTGGKGVATEEIPHFCQDDLCEEDVMLLDTGASLFVWQGAASSVNEQKGALELAEKYLASTKRDKDTAIAVIKSGNEPLSFTGYFHGWDSDKKIASAADYEARIAHLRAEMGPVKGLDPEKPSWAADAESKSKAAADASTSPAEASTKPPTEASAGTGAPATPAKPAAAPEASASESKPTESASEAAAAEQPAATTPKSAAVPEASPAAAPSTPEPAQTNGSRVQAGIASLSKEPVAKEAAQAPRPDASPKTKAKPLTPQTQRGTYEPEPTDPSGSKGVEIKYKVGQDVIDYEKLKEMRGADGIDPAIKEQYLSEEEFTKVFGVERQAFMKLPLWRRQQEKKKHSLF